MKSQIMSRNYQIPLHLEFRPTKMKWSVTSIKVLGWRHELMAAGNAETLQDVVGGLGADSIVLSIDPDLYQALVPELNWGEPLVTISLNELPSSFVTACKPPASLEDSFPDSIKGREFPILLGSYEERPSRGAIMRPEQMRDEFFSMGDDLRELARFANKWGSWDDTYLSNFSGDDEIGIEGPLIPCIFPHQILAQRAGYRAARQARPGKWLGSSRAVIPTNQRDQKPYFFAEASSCRSVIEYLITLDHLRDARIAVCARTDCGAQYEVVSTHRRLYCSTECAHLVAVRKSRERARSGKARGLLRSR